MPFRRRDVLAGLGALSAVPALSAETWRVPAEEARHQATFMMWPSSRAVYPDRWHLEEVQGTIARLANHIAAFEPVILLADHALHRAMRRLLRGDIALWDLPTDDLWARDAGPLFTTNGRGALAVAGLQFNGWGGKQDATNDIQVAKRVAERLGLPIFASTLKGEPGGVDHSVDHSGGDGLMIAHESSWIIANRNPGMPRAAVEAELLRLYGAKRMLWAPGLRGLDITDYHIDSLARLTGPGRALITLPETPDPRDPFHKAALETLAVFRRAGLQVEVIPEPVTRRVAHPDFVASYANYYVCNGAVILPEFGDRSADATAAEALARHFPGREVVQIRADALGELGGGIHCATQQMPATG